MAQRIESIDVIEDPRLKKFLEDNDYSKVFDLEEENLSIVRFKDIKETRRNISERYFEIDQQTFDKKLIKTRLNDCEWFPDLLAAVDKQKERCFCRMVVKDFYKIYAVSTTGYGKLCHR